MAETFDVREYTEGGRSPFAGWFDELDAVTAAPGGQIRPRGLKRATSARPNRYARVYLS